MSDDNVIDNEPSKAVLWLVGIAAALVTAANAAFWWGLLNG